MTILPTESSSTALSTGIRGGFLPSIVDIPLLFP